MMHGLERELDRPVYGLHHHLLRTAPVRRDVARRERRGGRPSGQRVPAPPRRTATRSGVPGRDQGHHEAVPRPVPARPVRSWWLHRDRVRAGVPIVPIAMTGTEETMPTLFRIPVDGAANLPVTLNMMLLGPLGAVVHFPAAIRARVFSNRSRSINPPASRSTPRARSGRATELVRARLQQELIVAGARDRGARTRCRRERIMLVGCGSPLSTSLAAHLSRRRGVDVVRGPHELGDHRALVAALVESGARTVVDTGLMRWGRQLDVDVIGTMRSRRPSPIPVSPSAPRWSSPRRWLPSPRPAALPPSAARARNCGRMPRRLQRTAFSRRRATSAGWPRCTRTSACRSSASPTLPAHHRGGPLAELLDSEVVPVVAGFDPMIQLLHIDDAAAVRSHTPAPVSSQARSTSPRHPPDGGMLRDRATAGEGDPRRRLVDHLARAIARDSALTTDTVEVLRFGRCVDTDLIAGTGFRPDRTTTECAQDGPATGSTCATAHQQTVARMHVSMSDLAGRVPT